MIICVNLNLNALSLNKIFPFLHFTFHARSTTAVRLPVSVCLGHDWTTFIDNLLIGLSRC